MLRGVGVLLIALVLGGVVAEGAIRALDLFAATRAVAGRGLPPDAAEGELVQRGYALLRERGQRLREAGVPFHDMTGLYAARTETIYRDVCCHVNLRGNELLAEAIAAAARGPSPQRAMPPGPAAEP